MARGGVFSNPGFRRLWVANSVGGLGQQFSVLALSVTIVQVLNATPDDNSTATGINEQREVSGYFVTAAGALHGFVWTAGTGMRDLNDLRQAGYSNTITLATDINEFGVITGRSTDASGGRHAFVAIPLP
jgi:probable HAF family extracellular repeat protein